MKMRVMAVLCSALAVSTSASAADAATKFVVGQVEATLSYCINVNPADKADYDAFRRRMKNMFTEAGLNAIRLNYNYRNAYSATRDWLQQQGEEGVQACKNSGFPHV